MENQLTKRSRRFRVWNYCPAREGYYMQSYETIKGNCLQFITEDLKYPKRTVMDYTGMDDSNGNPIYEGDIVRCYDAGATDPMWGMDKKHTGIIAYSAPIYSLLIKGKQTLDTPCLKHWDNDVYLDHWFNAESIEVIGNIYEQPHLLS